jgi:Fe-S-cluster-containing hydrogenase component 2
MKRHIVMIDESTCNGCGDCIAACHEGALQLIDGKARLVSDAYCDGLGACIGECPAGAIRVVERESEAFDEAAVRHHLAAQAASHSHANGCPGAALRTLDPTGAAEAGADLAAPPASMLGHWPVQLKLVPPHAPFLRHADLVVCADCVPFTVPDFHARYLAGRAIVVGCPKLDDLGHYTDKLAAIVEQAQPRRITVVTMEVPCCAGLAQAVRQAANVPGLTFPLEEHVAGIRGGIVRRVVRE